jgi:hypothetical protein
MYSYENYSASLSQDAGQFSYDEYNSILTFTASVPTEVAGTQYRADILSDNNLVWNGTIEVFTSQSLNKASYTNQIPLEDMYVSKDSNNQFIILE